VTQYYETRQIAGCANIDTKRWDCTEAPAQVPTLPCHSPGREQRDSSATNAMIDRARRRRAQPMKILIIGGTLFIGRELVARLVAAGHDVWVMHRKAGHDLGEKVGNITADRSDLDTVRQVLRRGNYDVVYDNVYDWQRGTPASQVEAAALACGDRLHRYVFMSSAGAYGGGLNHSEEDPLAADDYPNVYVSEKAASERALLRLHERSGFPAVTLRPPFVYGPGNPFYREAFLWDRLRDGRPIILPDGGDRLMQFVHVKDLVWACMRVLEVPEAAGQAFNIANAAPVMQAAFVEVAARVAGWPLRTVNIPRDRILAAGGQLVGANLYFGEFMDLPPITENVAKARRLLGFQATPFEDGLRETCNWYLAQQRRPVDYNFEDTLLTRA